MRPLFGRSLGTARIVLAGLGILLTAAAPSAAQSFGVGVRMAWVNTESDVDTEVVDTGSVRFTGGQIRFSLSQRMGIEVSLDRHSESFELLNQKVSETPIQVSLLMKLAAGSFQPFLLGGPGWYKRSVSPIEGPADELDVSTTEFGWHAGGGLEILAGKHFGIHGDYRYTFLDFNDDDDEEIGGGLPLPGFSRLLPGHKGSMWTAGVTVYF
jgi:opacity protein-like surface antigen